MQSVNSLWGLLMKFYKLAPLVIVLVTLTACNSLSGVRFVADRDSDAKGSKEELATEALNEHDQLDLEQGNRGFLSSVSTWLVRPVDAPVRSKVRVSKADKQQFENALLTIQSEEYEEAERLLFILTNDNPELSGAWFNLGLVYRKLGRLDDANTALQRALDANEGNVDTYNQLAIVAREQGQFSTAETLYLTALKRWPQHAGSHRNLGILYELYSGQWEKALVHYERYLQVSDSADTSVAHWVTDLKRRSQ